MRELAREESVRPSASRRRGNAERQSKVGESHMEMTKSFLNEAEGGVVRDIHRSRGAVGPGPAMKFLVRDTLPIFAPERLRVRHLEPHEDAREQLAQLLQTALCFDGFIQGSLSLIGILPEPACDRGFAQGAFDTMNPMQQNLSSTTLGACSAGGASP